MTDLQKEKIHAFIDDGYITEKQLIQKAIDKIETMGYRMDILMSVNKSTSITETIIAFIKNVYEK